MMIFFKGLLFTSLVETAANGRFHEQESPVSYWFKGW